MFDVTSSLYRENFPYWFWETYLERIVSPTIDNSKFDPDRHDQLLQDKRIKYARNNDFRALIGNIPKEYLVFNELSKLALNEYAERMLTDFDSWNRILWLLTKALGDLDKTEEQSDEEKMIIENYLYLKTLFAQRFPNKALELEQRTHKGKLETESPRPVCIECGSDHITSNGPLWYCQSCGRKWTKNPRRKQKL